MNFEAIFDGHLKTRSLIEFREASVRLNGQTVLSGINWRLMPGESWAVLGGNGAGKSTFMRLVRAEVTPAPGGGERIYRLDGKAQTTAVGVKERVALVSPEAQDRYLQIDWKLRVDDVIRSGFAATDYLYRRPDPSQRRRAEEIMDWLGVAWLRHRNVQELSTGELRRVLIARALVAKPQVLLLDEVCDGLDAPARKELLGGIERIVRTGTQVLYSTHRVGELIPSLTHALMLEGGRIVWQGEFAKVGVPVERGQPWAPEFPTISKAERARLSALHGNSCRSGVLFRLRGVNVYLNRKRVLRNLNWEMRAGENWAVLGANGAGKSTFLKLLAGDVHAAAGSTVERFEFTPPDGLWKLRERVGYLSPDLQAHYRDSVTGLQLVASGFFSSIGLVNHVNATQRRRVENLITEFGLSKLALRPAMRMSYGEFRKFLMLRALVREPAVLICDEPFDGLDASARGEFCATLDQVARNGTRLVTVTHHLSDLPQSTTHALVLEKGSVVCQGELDIVRKHPAMRKLFGTDESQQH